MNTNLTDCHSQDYCEVLSDHSSGFNVIERSLPKIGLSLFRIIACLFFSFYLFNGNLAAQTDFAPGEIMFTGYKSDDADAFSIVLLTNVVSGTVIYITDRGWSNTSGYRVDATAEGTISFTFTSDYPCGTEIFFNDIGGVNDWSATNIYGIAIGTTAIQAGGDIDGMELAVNAATNATGDQLTIYQLPEPTSGNQGSFVCMIQMDNNLVGGVDTDEESELPTALAANTIVRFNTEFDNAKYDCTPYVGTASVLRTAITNDNGAGGLKTDGSNNWMEADGNTITLSPCYFCCGSTPPAAAPTIDAPFVVTINSTFTINITGTLAPGASWQLFTAGCGVGSPIQTTMSNSFMVTAIGTEGFTTYYVRSSQTTDCSGICDAVTVHTCTNAENMNLCTSCTANEQTCGDCLLPYPANNPNLDSGCYALRLILVLDESGSISGNEQDVEDGVLAFLNALNGQDAQVALIEFSTQARLVNGYTVCDDNYIAAISGYFNGVQYNLQTYAPNGGTNWHDAMIKVDALTSADLVLFFTDGEPTVWTQANGATNDCPLQNGGTGTDPPEIVNPVKIANKIKGEGTHMFMLGVGGGINITNLQAMSGYDAYVNGVNTLGTADYSIGNFEDLAMDLEDFILELCRTEVEIRKEVVGPVCNDTVVFRFIVFNLGDESATGSVRVTDTFPSGYTNLMYNGTAANRVCPFNIICLPPQPPNAFSWGTQPIPPLSSDTLLITATVLPTGNYTNIVWAVTDNAATVSDTFPGSLLLQNTGPSITCPANVTISCSASTLPANAGNPNATDPEGPAPTVSYTDVVSNGSCPQAHIITRTWTATDNCGLTAACIQIITINDTAPPVPTCPPNITLACNSGTSPATTGTAIAIDLCDPNPTITFLDVIVPGVCVSDYTILRTWKATDHCGNFGTCIQTISLDDNIAPVLTCADKSILCSESILPSNPNLGFPAVTNDCSGSSTLTYIDNFVYQPTPPQCSIVRTWTATDNCGNSSTCNQIIVVKDPVLPTMTCPVNITVACSASTLPGNTGTATATDNCSIAPGISYLDAITTSPSCAQNYTITRSWKATDECGNTANCIQSITVVDNLSPTMSCPVNVTISCTASTLPASTGTATATDNCSSPTITRTDIIVPGICPQEKTITRTWRATDLCGNSSTCSQIIVVDDASPPVLNCPVNVTILCTASTLPANTGTATASDICSTFAVTSTDVVLTGICPQEKIITRTWKATDACGNSGTCNQIITVHDSAPPVINCPPNLTIECTAVTLPAQTGNATLTDNCDSTPTLTYHDVTVAGPTPNGYTIFRTWTGTDDCNNANTCMQIIRVDNPIEPHITGVASDTICSGQTEIFQAQNQGLGSATYQWNFGSGSSPGTASGIGPHTVTYNYNGTNGTVGAYVILSVSLPGCALVSDTVSNIHVNAVPNPAIDGLTTNLCYYRFRTFKPVAAQVPGYTYQWDFGSGASLPPTTGYGPHQVKYSTIGLKTVRLIVFSNAVGGSCGDTSTITFTVVACPANIAGRVRKPDGSPIGSVNLLLYPDVNLDGLPDPVDPIRSVGTVSSGTYSMVGLLPGQYTIVEVQLPGYISISEMDESNDFDTLVYSNSNDNILAVTLEASELDGDNVFVDSLSQGIITGYVFDDANNDVIPDFDEGIPGVTVSLYMDADQNGVPDPGAPESSTITSAIGWYQFGNVLPGNYTIVENQPGGYDSATDIDVTNDDDVIINTNMNNNIIPVSIFLGETDADNYFIEIQVCGNMVTNADDVGPGSLRYVIDCSMDGDTIVFHPFLQNQTIHLTSSRIEIDKDLHILSDLNPRLKIISDIPGAFLIDGGYTVEFKNIDVTGGLNGFPGSAFENHGNLIFWDMYIYRNVLLPPNNYIIFNSTSATITVKGGIQIDSN